MNTTITQIYVGVDISKNFLDFHLHPLNKAFRIDNNLQDIRKFIKELSKYNVEQIVYESSGGYEYLLSKELEKKQYKVWQVDPKRIKAFIVSEGINAKTDKIDAQMIALFAAQKQSKYQQVSLSEKEEQLQALTRRRVDLIEIILKEKNRLSHPQQVHCKQIISKHIAFMENQIKEIETAITQLINDDNDLNNKAKIISSVPGVGTVTTSALIAHMPELGKVTDKQAAALIGVAPFIRQSGNSKGTATIKGGRSMLRAIIYMAATIAIRYNPILKVFYDRLRAAGKGYKVAIVAIMRKLITLLNVMIKKEELWCPVK